MKKLICTKNNYNVYGSIVKNTNKTFTVSVEDENCEVYQSNHKSLKEAKTEALHKLKILFSHYSKSDFIFIKD